MSHPQPPQRQPTPPEVEKYIKTVHNVALVAVVACPVLALLPPRKLDFYTLGLIGVTGYSANYLIRESSGRSIWQHATRQPVHPAATHEQQQQTQQSIVGELQKSSRGDARETWKMQRQKEIQEEVEEGKGFADMIVDQIWEVWNQGKTKEEDDED